MPPRNEILKSLRGLDYDGIDRSIDSRVSRLRRNQLRRRFGRRGNIKTVRPHGWIPVQPKSPLERNGQKYSSLWILVLLTSATSYFIHTHFVDEAINSAKAIESRNSTKTHVRVRGEALRLSAKRVGSVRVAANQDSASVLSDALCPTPAAWLTRKRSRVWPMAMSRKNA